MSHVDDAKHKATTDRLEDNHIKMAPFNISLEFHRLLARIDCSNSLIGKLADGKLRMPKTSSDGRRRTWYKTIEVISRVCNHPTSRDDCWLVPPNTPHGLYSVKLSPNGSKNKWCGPRVVFALANPKELTYIEEREIRQACCSSLWKWTSCKLVQTHLSEPISLSVSSKCYQPRS